MTRPAWFDSTLAAWGTAAALLAGVVAWAVVAKVEASEAKAASDNLIPRVTTLEEQMRGQTKVLDEMKADLREILRRLK